MNKSNIHEESVEGHRRCKKLTNNDYGTVSFFINRDDISKNKSKNADSFKDKELRYNCIYFLVGYTEDNDNEIEKIYVGQAGIRDNGESVLDRLNEHAHNESNPDKYINDWEDIVIVTNRNNTWGATELNALEHIFCSLIPVGNRLNSKKQSSTGAELEPFKDAASQIVAYFNYLQFSIFNGKTEKDIKDAIKEIADRKSDLPVDLDKGTTKIPNITTPLKIVNEMLDKLPTDIWNDETVFLDPACKGGEYLRAIHDRLVEIPELIEKYGSKEALSMHILQEQLHGIALNQTSKNAAIKKLNGFKYNVITIPNYIEIIKNLINIKKENSSIDTKKLVLDLLSKEFNKDMKIDVVIGNPPYNETNEKTGSSKSINTYFVKLGIMTDAKYMSYIMPDRWFVSPDQLNKECRISLIGKLKYLRDFNNEEVFNGVNIAGGVSYFLYDRDYNGDMLYEDNSGSIHIKHNERFMCKSIQSNILFNHVKTTTKTFMDAKFISTSFFGLTRDKKGQATQTSTCNIRLKSSHGDTFLSVGDVPKNAGYIGKYKVAIPYSAMELKPFILKPNEICTLTYLIVRFFDNLDEAENCKKYLETNFCKILFNGLKTKLGSTRENFMCIPLQDFTSNSNIDWTQSISDIDKQLYKKYNLSDEEIIQITNGLSADSKPKKHTSNRANFKLTSTDAQANYINQMLKNQSSTP